MLSVMGVSVPGLPPQTLLDSAAKCQGIHNGTALLFSPSELWQALQEQMVQAGHFCHSCGRAAAVAQQLRDERALSQGPQATYSPCSPGCYTAYVANVATPTTYKLGVAHR